MSSRHLGIAALLSGLLVVSVLALLPYLEREDPDENLPSDVPRVGATENPPPFEIEAPESVPGSETTGNEDRPIPAGPEGVGFQITVVNDRGAAVPGAEVGFFIQHDGAWEPTHDGTTDERGMVQLPFPRDPPQLRVQAKGHVFNVRPLTRQDLQRGHIEVVISRTGTFLVFLRLPDGTPATNASIQVRSEETPRPLNGPIWRPFARADKDGDGRYRIADLAPVPYRIGVLMGRTMLRDVVREPSPGKETTVELTVNEPFRVVGTVHVADERVATGRLQFQGAIVLIEDGRFELQVPAPGDYDIQYFPGRGLSILFRSSIRAGQPLDLRYDLVEVRGRILYPDGQPVPRSRGQVRVQGSRLHFTANDEGRFTVPGVPTGEHVLNLTLIPQGFIAPAMPLVVGDEGLEVTLRLVAAKPLTIRFLCESPPENLAIHALPSDRSPFPLAARRTADREYSVDWPERLSRGYVTTKNHPPVEFELRSVSSHLDVPLQSGGILVVSIQTEEGLSLRNHLVEIVPLSNPDLRAPELFTSTGSSEARISLLEGTYEVHTTTARGKPVQKRASVIPGETTTISFP